MIQAHFKENEDSNTTSIERINLGGSSESKYLKVLVHPNEKPSILVCVNVDGEHQCFKDIKQSGNTVFIGCGEHIHIFNVVNKTSKSIKLNGYFGAIYPVDDIDSNYINQSFLVASANNLTHINKDGDTLWVSQKLGIDGVVVNSIFDGTINGAGEWDPPGGWKNFNLSLENGKSI